MTAVSPLGVGLVLGDGTVSPQVLIQLLNDLRNGVITLWLSGTTAQRPTDPYLGQIYYDTTLPGLVQCTAIRNGAVPAVWGPIAVSNQVAILTSGAGNYTTKSNLLLVTMIGAGSSGQGGSSPSVGGGAAEYIHQYTYPTTAGATIAYSVAAAGGAPVANAPAGADSTFGTLTAQGGRVTAFPAGASGGGRLGATGANSPGNPGNTEGLQSIGGASGGGATFAGGPSEIFAGGTSAAATGGGGGSSPFGQGGAGGAAGNNGGSPAATAYGAGGGGSNGAGKTGGPSIGGIIIIQEIGQ